MGIDLVEININFPQGPIKQECLADFERFYQQLQESTELPTTSQPSPQDYFNLLKQAQSQQEEVLIITLSSGLSGTYNTTLMVKEMFENNDFITVFDSQHASLSQRILVEEAVQLRNASKSMREIVLHLEDIKHRIEIRAIMDTLTYLKRGGRIPSSLATIGNILKFKPILSMPDGTLQSNGIARGMKSAKKTILSTLEQFQIDEQYPLYFGYTGSKADLNTLKDFQSDCELIFPKLTSVIHPVGGVIGTHLGPGAIITAIVKKDGAN